MAAFQTANFGFQGVGQFGFQEVAGVVVVPPSGGGASGVYKYRAPKWWEEGRRAKLQKELKRQVEAIQLRIEKKRRQIDVAPDLYRMERLIEQLQELQKKLLDLLSRIDDLNKQFEEEEVLRIYTIYRSLH